MTKRILSLILLLILSFSLVSCGKDKGYEEHYYNDPTSPSADPTPSAQPADPEPDTGTNTEPDENPYAEALESEFPSYKIECEYQDMLRMEALAADFNNYPEVFYQTSTLSNSAKFFAAVTYLSGEFQDAGDGFTLSLPISRVEEVIPVIFGDGARLASDWIEGNYSPYQLDLENDQVYSYGQGSVSTFYYSWAVTANDDGTYQLWMLNLLDPLFYDVEENQGVIETGNASAVPLDSLEKIARLMQTNVYTFEKTSSGIHLIGFEYKNYKGVPNFVS